MKSAPGADGISNHFIKHFWEIFKYPLLKYANFCFERGTLSDSFRRAKIKLLYKCKGDLSNFKNWRPISLLNCFYKCISRAIANRLKTVIDKLTPVSQRGYSKSRQCQEVLISVIEGVNEAKLKNKKGAVLCLDIAKAFDKIKHDYMNGVYRFFGFGDNLIKWLNLLGMYW